MASVPFIRLLETSTIVKLPLSFEKDYLNNVKPGVYNNMLFLTIRNVTVLGPVRTEFSMEGPYMEIPVSITGFGVEVTQNVVYSCTIDEIVFYLGPVIKRPGISVTVKKTNTMRDNGAVIALSASKQVYRVGDTICFMYIEPEPYVFTEGNNILNVVHVE